MTQEKIYLKDYNSPAYLVENIHLDFNLNEESCLVTSLARYKKLKNDALELDGVEIKLKQIKLSGRILSPADYQLTPEKLILKNLPENFELEIITELEPQNNTSLEGLYKSNGIFCTQCEAQGFRKITYYLDRPDVMTRFSVTIEADKNKYPVLLSNGDRVKIEDCGNNRHKAYWNDPHKKPCYLFALVAGDLGLIQDNFTTQTGRKVNLEIYAAHGKQDRCAHAMESLKKAMKWDEVTYGLEYDLNDYMIVAIDDFNAGAMENKGLNIFNSRLVFADQKTATDTDFQAIESVVAHEYFHNWTGNRVTLRDWFQLSLKEGLTVFRDQEFSADMTDRGVQRIEDVDGLRAGQFTEDAGPNAHPVRPESCMAVDNFFTMTIYEKGSEVIRMMQNIVGKKGFRKGMDEYFKRHDGQAVTTEDFAAAISEANNKDFSQFKLWYNQAGTPRVDVIDHYDAAKKEYTLSLKQSCAPTLQQPTKKPFYIPLIVGLLDSRGQEMTLECDQLYKNSDDKYLIELRQEQEQIVFKNVQEKPVLSILREFSAPIHLNWETDDKNYYFLMQKDTDSFNRRESAQKMASKVLQSLYHQAMHQQKLEVSKEFVEAIGTVILDQNLDPAFKANMLRLPADSILLQSYQVIDAKALLESRTALKQAISDKYYDAFMQIYKNLQNKKDAKSRQLKNSALSYLAQGNQNEALQLLQSQYQQADNMTDKMAAMGQLVHFDSAITDQILESFYQDWKNDSLVLNKWFTVQAQSTRNNAFAQIVQLTQHPAFNIQNPNNVYSLLRAFSTNLVRFHDNDINTYTFYADKIIEIDSKNPQVAARLCAAFNLNAKLNATKKAQAENEIKRILATDQLSKNSRELLLASVN